MAPRNEVTVAGSYEGREGYALRDFLTHIDQPFTWLDTATEGDEVRAFLERHAPSGGDSQPLVVIDGAQALAAPSLELLADALGIRYPPRRREYDVIIIGAGPAGLAAAVYAASDGLRTVVAERASPGGQAAYTSRIENYFGLDPLAEPMTGAHLTRIGGRQAEGFGAELLVLRGVVGGGREGNGRHRVVIATGEELEAPALICATGVDWRRLDLDGLEDLVGRGIYYGAGRSEAPRFRRQRVAVVGGGNSAGQAVLNFAAYADRVTMVCRGSTLGASLSQYLIDRIEREPRIDVRLRTRVARIHADSHLEAVTLEDSEGREEQLRIDGLFVAIGGAAQTEWAEGGSIVRDEGGYLVTGPDLRTRDDLLQRWPLARPPLTLESSLPGFFVSGDVRHGSTKRVAAAVGEGAMAVAQVHRYLEEQRKR